MTQNTINAQNAGNSTIEGCPSPVLSRLKRHTIIEGETLPSIAQQYNLVSETLINFNPTVKDRTLKAGEIILIPPYNGIRVNVPQGATWKDISEAYGVRADVLFELNGCQPRPSVVFIPGLNWIAQQKPTKTDDYTGLSGYPLPSVTQIGLAYGWHTDPATKTSVFHSGVDLLAELNTPVLVPEKGQVIFKGNEPNYGFLVIIDHGKGRQTRYAHLSKVTVDIGQTVITGETLGYVGTTGKPDIPQPHLHFEVRYQLPVGWVAQDPMLHLGIKK